MRPLERAKVFEEGGPRAENVFEDGLRPAQSLDLMRTGLRPLVVSLPTYNRLCALLTGRVHLEADPQAFLVVLEGRSDPPVEVREWHGRGG